MYDDDIDDILGGGKSAPALNLDEEGQEVKFIVTGKPRSGQERKFVGKGKTGPLMYWQGGKPTEEDKLNQNLPFQPMKQIITPVRLQDGAEHTIYWSGEKLKALKAAIRNSGERLAEGSMGKLKLSELRDTGAPSPKKIYEAAIKSPKE